MKLILDTHIHTIASGHAYSTVMENVSVAAEKGLKLIAITDHGPEMPGSCLRPYFANMGAITKEIKGVRVLTGTEVNIMDINGKLDLADGTLSKLNVVIASLHGLCIKPMTKEENTEAVINAIKNPYVKVIGHLGDPNYPVDIDPIIEACKKHNTFLEINNASLYPGSIRSGGEEEVFNIMKRCKEEKWPIIVGSDAHFCDTVGDFKFVLPMLESLDMPENLVINTSLDLFRELIVNY